MKDFRLADRMGRLGTESAFEVLARAKAMEAAGHKFRSAKEIDSKLEEKKRIG